jgi:hypothetical protein
LTDALAQALSTLEADRKKLLLAEEEMWRQKSRAIWIKSGDKNTKFFHHFASYRRNKKHIWEVKDQNNLCYKIIAKVITKRIGPILSRGLSQEQMGFLKGRQIVTHPRRGIKNFDFLKGQELHS